MESDTHYIVRNIIPGQPVEALRMVIGPKIEADKIARILSFNSQNGGYMAVRQVDILPDHVRDDKDSTATLLRYYAALGMGE